MALRPSFTVPKSWAVQTNVAAAETDLTSPATTNAVTLVTGGANGSKVDEIRCMQLVTIASTCIVNLFKSDGTNRFFFDFFTFGADTIGATDEVEPQVKYYDNLTIPNGWSLIAYVTTTAADGAFDLVAEGGDY